MKPEFKKFQKLFTAYQNKFGLNNYQVYFKYEPIEGAFADITRTQESMIATVRLNNQLTKEDEPFQDIHANAKHEAIHLLLSRFSDLAYSRCATRSAIYEAEEELVRRLENLIPDLKLDKGK